MSSEAIGQLLPVLVWLIPIIVIGIIAQFVWTGVITFLVYRLQKTDRNFEQMKVQLELRNERIIDERFKGLGPVHELAIVNALNTLREEIRDCTASKDDHNDLKDRIESLSDSVNTLTREVITASEMRRLFKEIKDA